MTQAELFRGAHLTLREAAEACGVSHSTIKRRQAEFEHAYQDQTGSWRVPVSDLLGAGLKLRPMSAEPVVQGHAPGQNYPDLAQAHAQIEALKAELADERTARQIAEAKATAEARIAALYAANLEDLRYSLRALNGPPQPEEGTQDTPHAPVPDVATVQSSGSRDRVENGMSQGVGDLPPDREAVPRRAAPPRRGFRAWLRGG